MSRSQFSQFVFTLILVGSFAVAPCVRAQDTRREFAKRAVAATCVWGLAYTRPASAAIVMPTIPLRSHWLAVTSPARQQFGFELLRESRAHFAEIQSGINRAGSLRAEDSQIDLFWQGVRQRLNQASAESGTFPISPRYEIRVNENILLVVHPELQIHYDGWREVEYDRRVSRERAVVASTLGKSANYRLRVDGFWTSPETPDDYEMTQALRSLTRAVRETEKRDTFIY